MYGDKFSSNLTFYVAYYRFIVYGDKFSSNLTFYVASYKSSTIDAVLKQYMQMNEKFKSYTIPVNDIPIPNIVGPECRKLARWS